MIGSIIGALSAGLQIVLKFFQRKEREEQQAVGAMAQRESDQKATIDAQRDQLDKATNARPGDGARRLRDGNF